jgi:REP element-mobilizing transposase RayT
MKKTIQLSLFKNFNNPIRVFGGSLLHGKRRNARPLSTKEPIHVVLRSSWAGGAFSFLLSKNKKTIEHQLRVTSKRYGVKVYRSAIVSNHLHLIIQIHNRKAYLNFIRVFSGQVASHMMNRRSFRQFQKSLPSQNRDSAEVQGSGQAFWQFRPWTRVLYWGKDFRSACAYVLQNTLEALGFISYRPRNKKRTSGAIGSRFALWGQT